MKTIPDDICRWIRDAFPASETETTDVICAFLNEPYGPRIARCLLFLAGGSVVALHALAEHTKCDYRDIIFWAEYTDHEAERVRIVRSFSAPIDLKKTGAPDPAIQKLVGQITDKWRSPTIACTRLGNPPEGGSPSS